MVVIDLKIKELNIGLNERDLVIPIKDKRFDSEDSQSNSRQVVNEMLYISRLKMADLAKRLNQLYPGEKFTTQNLSNKLFRGGLRDFELAQIANACGFELQLVSRDLISLNNAVAEAVDDNANYKMEQALKQGQEMIDTKSNGLLVIAGENATEAAKAYRLHCANADALTELGFSKILEKKYGVITKFVSDSFDL